MSLQGARRSCRNDEVQAASEYHLSGDTLFLIRNSSPGVVENRCSCAATKAHATRDPVENPENKCFELQSFFSGSSFRGLEIFHATTKVLT